MPTKWLEQGVLESKTGTFFCPLLYGVTVYSRLQHYEYLHAKEQKCHYFHTPLNQSIEGTVWHTENRAWLVMCVAL